MECPYCGSTVPQDAAYCGNCGAKLESAKAPEVLPGPISGPAEETVTPQQEQPVSPPPSFTPAFSVTPPASPARRNTGYIIALVIVVLLLLCCCCLLTIIAVLGASGTLLETFAPAAGWL